MILSTCVRQEIIRLNTIFVIGFYRNNNINAIIANYYNTDVIVFVLQNAIGVRRIQYTRMFHCN